MSMSSEPTPLESRLPSGAETNSSGAMSAASPSESVPPSSPEVALDIRDLKTYFFTYDGVVKALDGVTFRIHRGRTTGLVGETGCGKSVTAFSVTRLINDPPGRVISGTIRYHGANLLWALGAEAKFVPTNRRALRRLHAEVDATLLALTAAFPGNAEAEAVLVDLRASIGELRKISIGTDSEVGRQLLQIGAQLDRLSAIASSGSTAVPLIEKLRATAVALDTAYAESETKVKRSFRRVKAANDRLSSVRGRGISMIFQEPTQAMNPVFSIANQLGEVLLLHRGKEVIDEMLGAEPGSPGAGPAIEALLVSASQGDRMAMRSAAERLGDAVHLSSFGTEAFYAVRDLGPLAREAGPVLRRALRRRHLSSGQRRYLAHRRRLLELRERISAEHVGEMREERPHRGALRRLRARQRVERWFHFYYGIWGVRGRIQKTLNTELFWRVVRQLEGVAIANPAQIARGYPHELSGGMLQRVMISMALSAEPEVLIADEPTTALDVTIQAQILELMRELRNRVGTAILLITHDLAVIAEVADHVCVMYAGSIVEQGPVREIFSRPLHPYAQGLLGSIPRLDQPGKELNSIPGSVPDLIHPPTGCRFHPRCPYAMPICKQVRPPVTLEGPEHSVACYLYKGPVVADQS